MRRRSRPHRPASTRPHRSYGTRHPTGSGTRLACPSARQRSLARRMRSRPQPLARRGLARLGAAAVAAASETSGSWPRCSTRSSAGPTTGAPRPRPPPRRHARTQPPRVRTDEATGPPQSALGRRCWRGEILPPGRSAAPAHGQSRRARHRRTSSGTSALSARSLRACTRRRRGVGRQPLRQRRPLRRRRLPARRRCLRRRSSSRRCSDGTSRRRCTAQRRDQWSSRPARAGGVRRAGVSGAGLLEREAVRRPEGRRGARQCCSSQRGRWLTSSPSSLPIRASRRCVCGRPRAEPPPPPPPPCRSTPQPCWRYQHH